MFPGSHQVPGQGRYKPGAGKTVAIPVHKMEPFRWDTTPRPRNMRKIFRSRENISKENLKPDEKPEALDPQKTQAALDEKSRQLYAMQFKLTLCKSEISNKDEELTRQRASLTSLKNLFDKKKETMDATLEENKKQQDKLTLELKHLAEKMSNLETGTNKKLQEQQTQILTLSTSLATKEEEVKNMKRDLAKLQIQTQEQKLLNDKFESKGTEVEKKLWKQQLEIEGLLAQLTTSKEELVKVNSDFKAFQASVNDELKNLRQQKEDEDALTQKALSEIKDNSQGFQNFTKTANKHPENEAVPQTDVDLQTEPENFPPSVEYHVTLRQMTGALTMLLEASNTEIAFLKSIIARKDSEIQVLMEGEAI